MQPIPVIIPFYKNKKQLKRCKTHLAHQTTKVNVWVKDNSTNNDYFTGAVNKGLKHFLFCDCKYIIIIDQDMYLEPDAVGWMVQFMDKNPLCGIVTPLVKLMNNGQQVISGGGADMYPSGNYIGIIRGRFDDAPLFWAESTCWILRKEMVVEIGLLDPNYRVLFMDSDYCLTARSRGWQVWRISNAIGEHERSHSLNPAFMSEEKRVDLALFEAKWVNGTPGNLFSILDYKQDEIPVSIGNYSNTELLRARGGKIMTSDTAHHLSFLKQICFDTNAKLVLELGVRKGESTRSFLSAMEKLNGKLISIDIDDCSGVSNSPNWEFHQMNDLDFDTNSDEFDIIFIDTSHTYEQTLAELRKFAPKLKSSGVILLHDTLTFQSVSEAIQTYLKENPNRYRFENRKGSNGLGVLRERENVVIGNN